MHDDYGDNAKQLPCRGYVHPAVCMWNPTARKPPPPAYLQLRLVQELEDGRHLLIGDTLGHQRPAALEPLLVQLLLLRRPPLLLQGHGLGLLLRRWLCCLWGLGLQLLRCNPSRGTGPPVHERVSGGGRLLLRRRLLRIRVPTLLRSCTRWRDCVVRAADGGLLLTPSALSWLLVVAVVGLPGAVGGCRSTAAPKLLVSSCRCRPPATARRPAAQLQAQPSLRSLAAPGLCGRASLLVAVLGTGAAAALRLLCRHAAVQMAGRPAALRDQRLARRDRAFFAGSSVVPVVIRADAICRSWLPGRVLRAAPQAALRLVRRSSSASCGARVRSCRLGPWRPPTAGICATLQPQHLRLCLALGTRHGPH